ncbi:MAG: pyridoxamine 5'-phosphate oxidase family protein [bacterium]|nr:pyridoxamine 5'-phosphate oxidase family protein [bacterium]
MEFPEYELAGIETIARGVCIQNDKVLLCRAKGGATSYLPGGHIDFGETGRQALVRELQEEMGVDATAGTLLGVVENQFQQHGKPHAEINLVYRLSIPEGTPATAKEDWIEFEWRDLSDLDAANLLPVEMKKFLVSEVPLRRRDRALTREEALAILARAETATVSLVTPQGPYGFPISPVCVNGKLYFHSATAGRKIDALKADPRCWVSAYTDVVPATDKFTTYFESAMAWGDLERVTDEQEIHAALKALCEKFTPTNMPDFSRALERSLPITALYSLRLDHVSGKAKRRK